MATQTVSYNITLTGKDSSGRDSSSVAHSRYPLYYRVTSISNPLPAGATNIHVAAGNSYSLYFNYMQYNRNVVEFELDNSAGTWICDHDDDQITVSPNGDGTYEYVFTNYNNDTKDIQMWAGYSGMIHFWPSEPYITAFHLSGISGTGSIKITYNYDPPGPSSRSTISLTSTPVNLGGTLVYAIDGDSRCTHTVKVSFAGRQKETTVVGTGRDKTIVIDEDWVEAIPNESSGTVTVQLTTFYNGQQKGEPHTAQFTIRVPDSYKPKITGLTASMITDPSNATVNGWGLYVQGISKAHLVATGASDTGGASVRSYHFLKADGTEIANVSAPTNTYNAVLPVQAGASFNTQFKCYVEDTRGRTSNAVSSNLITVYDYSTPTISAMSAIRCNSAGVAKEEGTYFKVSFIASFASVGGKNLTNCTYQIQWKKSNASTWRSDSTKSITFDSGATSKSISTTIGSDSDQSADYITPETDYLVKVTIRDTLGQPAEKEVELGTISYTMFFKKGGQGVAIGQPTQEASAAFEVNPEWAMIWGYLDTAHNKPIRIPGVIYTDKNTTLTDDQGRLGMIWLKET